MSERGGVERASGERRQEGDSPGGLFSRTRRCCSDRSLGTKRLVERQLPNLHAPGDSVHLDPCTLHLGMARSFWDGSFHSVSQDSDMITRIPGREDTGTCTELQTLTAVRAHRHVHTCTQTRPSRESRSWVGRKLGGREETTGPREPRALGFWPLGLPANMWCDL